MNLGQNMLSWLQRFYEMKCDSLEKGKAKLLDESTCKGRTIKKLKEEVKSTLSSYQESEDFTEVKVHSFLEGFQYDEAKAQAYYADYTLEFGNFTLSDMVTETITRTQAWDTRRAGSVGSCALGQGVGE